MNHIPPELPDAISRLAEIRRNGKLSDLLQHHAVECRQLDLPSFRDYCEPGIDLETKELSRAVEQLFGVSAAAAEPIVRWVVQAHPRIEVALELIAEHRPRRSRVPTPEEVANWNPHTGGPAVEQWEDEQRRIALAKTRRTEPKRKERAWYINS